MSEFKLDSGSKIPEHPLLSSLNEGNASNVITVKGYVGPSSSPDHIRLYADLADLSESVDIARSDILYFAEAPDTVLPLGGAIIWVKQEARIVVRSVETAALAPKVDESVELSRGRLRIRVHGGLSQSVCQSRCQVCQSRCKVCQSRCKAFTWGRGRLDQVGNFAFPQMRER